MVEFLSQSSSVYELSEVGFLKGLVRDANASVRRAMEDMVRPASGACHGRTPGHFGALDVTRQSCGEELGHQAHRLMVQHAMVSFASTKSEPGSVAVVAAERRMVHGRSAGRSTMTSTASRQARVS